MRSSSPDIPKKSILPQADTTDARTDIERAVDARIENLILKNALKINEGNNGIIFKFNLGELDAADRKALEECCFGVEEGEAVLKLLKVYQPGAGKREYEMQSRAFDIVQSAPDPQEVARVPRPQFYRTIGIGDEARSYLGRLGIKTPGQKVEVLVMDIIPGTDVATILYREVVKRHPKSTLRDAPEPDRIPIEVLHDEVARLLEYAKPGGRSRDEAMQSFERDRVFNQNAAKLFEYIKTSGFVLHPAIVNQIERSLSLFHEQGLVFRDGHERNFMVVGSPEAGASEAPQAYIIDYGNSRTFAGDYSTQRTDLYVEDTAEGLKRYSDDSMVLNRLRPLTLSREVAAEQARKQFMVEVRRFRKSASADPAWKREFERVRSSDDPPQAFERSATLFASLNPERLIALMDALVEEGTFDIEAAADLMQSYAGEQISKYRDTLK